VWVRVPLYLATVSQSLTPPLTTFHTISLSSLCTAFPSIRGFVSVTFALLLALFFFALALCRSSARFLLRSRCLCTVVFRFYHWRIARGARAGPLSFDLWLCPADCQLHVSSGTWSSKQDSLFAVVATPLLSIAVL